MPRFLADSEAPRLQGCRRIFNGGKAVARLVKPLTVTQVNNAKPKPKMYKMFDGGGLFIQVNPSGGKHWKMKYRKDDDKE